MKSDRWLYRSDGQEFGPVPFDVIAQLAKSGVLTPRDDVCREGSPWEPAGEIVGLFEDSRPAEISDSAAPAADIAAPDFADVLQSAPEVDIVPATEFDDVLRFAPVAEMAAQQTRPATADLQRDLEFYCRIAGVEVGPLTLGALQSWIEQGRLSASDELRPSGSGTWLPASTVEHLRFPPPADRKNAAKATPRNGSLQEIESLALDILSQSDVEASGGRTARTGAVEKSTAPDAGSLRPQLERPAPRSAAALQPLMAAALSEQRPAKTRPPRRRPELGLPSSPLVYTLAALIVFAMAVKLWPDGGGALHGRVLVDGKALPVGSISFVSGTAPSAESSFTAVILEGSYAISDRSEIAAGPYEVVVTVGSPLGEPPPEIADDAFFAPLNGGRFSQTSVSPDPDSRVLDFSLSAADAQWPAQGEGPEGQDIHRLQ